MRLLSLEVANYRNIAAAQLEPGRELTVICGNNGQGKTNLLEAIWLLTGGKSFRGGKDAELVRRGETFAVLEAVTQRTRQEDQEPDDPARVRITVGTPDAQRPGRYASVNGAPPKRAAGLAGSFPAVVFAPGHLSLVKGAPEGRRRFLDAALCQLYPGYLATYRRYVRALQQKNALLRHSAGGTERPWAEKCALLEVLNVELAAQGEAIQKRRREYLALLGPLACANYAELSHGAERMAVHYAAQFEPGGLSALLKQRQNEELRAGQSLCGKFQVQHFQQGAFFCPRALRAACGMTQKRVFLLQCPHIAAVGGKVAGVQLAQRRVQKTPPSFRCTFYKAQVPGVEHHSRKAARKARRPLGRRAVDRCIPAGALCIRRAHRNAHICRFVRFLILLPGALGDGLQYRECFSAAHKLGILAAPEAFAAGQKPDGLQQVRFALTVVAADHGQLPARFQLRCRNIAVIRNFQ